MKLPKIGTISILLATLCFASCQDKEYDKEMYKNVIYLLSGSDNTYTEAYTMEEEEVVRYFSIGCGGSLSNSEAVTVTLHPDTELLAKYNKSNFDIDTESYAKILPADRYEIASYTVTIPANHTDQYLKVPVKVRPRGLSPDSIYFIPLAIKSVSHYEVNPEKYNLLYRVTIENDYAEQKTVTSYAKKGTVKGQTSGSESILSGSKIVQPLSVDEVRMFAGNNTQTARSSVADIERYALVARVNPDKTLTLSTYGTMEIEQLSDPLYNFYAKEGTGNRERSYLYLYYRFRTLTTPATETAEAVWSEWFEVKETLTRSE